MVIVGVYSNKRKSLEDGQKFNGDKDPPLPFDIDYATIEDCELSRSTKAKL